MDNTKLLNFLQNVNLNSIKVLNFVESFNLDDIRRRLESYSEMSYQVIIEYVKENYYKSIEDSILFIIVPQGKEIPIKILKENFSGLSFLISLDSEITNRYNNCFDNFIELSSEEEAEKFILGISLQIIGTTLIDVDIFDLRELFQNKGQVYMKELDSNNLEGIKDFSKVNSVFISMSYRELPSLERPFELFEGVNGSLDFNELIIGVCEDKLQQKEEEIIVYTTT